MLESDGVAYGDFMYLTMRDVPVWPPCLLPSSPRHNLAATDLWWWLKAAILNLGLMFFLFLFTTPAVFMNLLDEWRYKDALNAINVSLSAPPLIPSLKGNLSVRL